jgi:hypothetical protein
MIKLAESKNKEYDKFIDKCIVTHLTGVKSVPFSAKSNTPPVLYMLKNSRVDFCFVDDRGCSPMDNLKPLVYEHKPECYVFCAEAWVKTVSKNNTEDVKEVKKRIAEHGVIGEHDKKEVLVIIAAKYNGEKRVYHFDIVRDETNAIKDLVNWGNDYSNSFVSEKTP